MTLSFWAQNLENRGSDHFRLGNDDFTSGDPAAQRIIADISEITRGRTAIAVGGGVRYFQSGDDFVVEVASDATDEAGRTSPIQCRGRVPADHGTAVGWKEAVVSAFEGFAADAGRPIPASAIGELREALDTLEKKKSAMNARHRRTLSLIITGALVVAALLVWHECGSGPDSGASSPEDGSEVGAEP